MSNAWTAGFGDTEFWNPKIRAPNCFNPPAVRSVLPQYLRRTDWVLAGMSEAQMIEKARAAFARPPLYPPGGGLVVIHALEATWRCGGRPILIECSRRGRIRANRDGPCASSSRRH